VECCTRLQYCLDCISLTFFRFFSSLDVDGPFPMLFLVFLCFLDLLEGLSHVCQLLLNYVPVVHNIVEILGYTILNHSGYHFCIILHDRVFWRCSLHLHLLACTPHLSGWSLSQVGFLWIGTPCSPLHCLSLFLLFLGRLHIILLPLLGPRLSCPFVCMIFFSSPSFISWALGLPEALFLPALSSLPLSL
jgi:hypothetical protein